MPEGKKANSDNDKLMGILAYLGILVIVPIIAGGDSKFIKYHANQGLVNILFAIAIGVLGFVLAFIPYINFILIFYWVLYFVPTVFAILGIINVVNGEQKPLPLIGGVTLIK